MKTFETDLLIVGAGPAGLKTAIHASKSGIENILVIDRKQEIGFPVRCGEALSSAWMKKTGVRPNPRFCLQKVFGSLDVAPNGSIVEARNGLTGYVMDRKIFEKELAKEAARAGVNVQVKTMATSVIMKDKYVRGVSGVSYGEPFRASAEITIAADGVDSRIARMAGINTVLPLNDADAGFEYEMVGISLLNPRRLEFHFGNEIAPRGYVWVFPKGNDCANVGVIIRPPSKKTPKQYLDEFIRKNSDRFGKGSIIEAKAGVVPVGGFEIRTYSDGLLLVGDAARQVNPLHGGGIGLAMYAGMCAAKTAAEALEIRDTSGRFLKRYEDRWAKEQGKYLRNALAARGIIESLTDKQLNTMADILSGEDLFGVLSGTGLVKTGAKLLRKDPKLAAKIIRMAARFAQSYDPNQIYL